MRLKQWFVVLLAVMVLALGVFAHPRECAAGFNDDVAFVQPPGGESGDPDSGGQGRYFWTTAYQWTLAVRRAVARAWANGVAQATTRVGRASESSRQPAAPRK